MISLLLVLLGTRFGIYFPTLLILLLGGVNFRKVLQRAHVLSRHPIRLPRLELFVPSRNGIPLLLALLLYALLLHLRLDFFCFTQSLVECTCILTDKAAASSHHFFHSLCGIA